MILQKSWFTVKKIKYHPVFNYKKVWWRGWFLFGFLPLFIKATETEYSNSKR